MHARRAGYHTLHRLFTVKLPSALCACLRCRSRPAAPIQALRDPKQALVRGHGWPCHAALLCQAVVFACLCPSLRGMPRAWDTVKGGTKPSLVTAVQREPLFNMGKRKCCPSCISKPTKHHAQVVQIT